MKAARSKQKKNPFSPLEPADRLPPTASRQLSQCGAPELNESSQIKLGRCAWCNPPNIHVQAFHFIYRGQLFVDCWIHHKGMYRSQAKCEVSLFFVLLVCASPTSSQTKGQFFSLMKTFSMWCYLWEEKQTVNTLNKNIYSSIFCKCLASLILLFLHFIRTSYFILDIWISNISFNAPKKHILWSMWISAANWTECVAEAQTNF